MKRLLLVALLVPSVGAFAQRIPLFENFSSSTCGPCKNGNAVYKGVVDTKPAGSYVSVKYQQNFPGSGDPYATAETVNRRSSYYAINSIPRMEADGGWDQNAASFTAALYDQFKAVAPTYKLHGAYTFNATTKEVTAKVTFAPLNTTVAAAGAKLHIVIVESVTEDNVKSNQETKFYDVVKKMLPNQNGSTLLATTVGKDSTRTLTYKFEGAYRLPADGTTANQINLATEHSVENFANLKVVAWVQGANKEVYQAANLMKVNSLGVDAPTNTIADVNVFPNPAKNVVNVDFTIKDADNISALIIDLNGSVVASKSVNMKAGKNQISISTESLASGYYNLMIADSKTNAFTQKLTIVH